MKNKFIDWSGEDGLEGVGRSGIRYAIVERGSVFRGCYYPVWLRDNDQWNLVPIGDANTFKETIRASKAAARAFEQQQQQQQQPAPVAVAADVTADELREQTTWYRNALRYWPDSINANVWQTTIDVLERAATTIERTR